MDVAALLGEWGPVEWVAGGITLLSVFLCIRAVLIYFPIAIVSVLLYAWVFWEYDLPFNAGLQVFVYLPMLAIGWWHWLRGGPRRQDDLPIRRQSWVGNVVCMAIMVAGTLALPHVLTPAEAGSAKAYADAGTTVASVVGQYLLTRKYIENWIVWVAVDAVCCFYLYPMQKLWVTTGLYFVLLVLAFVGWVRWMPALRAGRAHA